MVKNCINPKCGKEISSSATFCLFCGTQQVANKKLSEEERLRKEMAQAEATIKILKKSLAETQEKIQSGTSNKEIEALEKRLTVSNEKIEVLEKKLAVSNEEIEVSEKKLATEQTKQKNLQNLIDSKTEQIERLKLASKRKKKSGGLMFFMLFFLLTTLVLSGVCVSLNKKLQQTNSISQSEIGNNSDLQDEINSLKSMNSKLENENQKLQQDYSNIQSEIKNSGNNSSNLQEEIKNLKSTNNELENENKKLRQDYISSQNEIANLKKQVPQKYETLDSNQSFYDKHGDYEYGHFPNKVVVEIYTQRNGYGLSDDGWIPMSRLRKIE
ncbi:MAG: hypothetical protein LBE91_07440 [Tannerella sp.]|jgi:predicted  nucleic acid-binding Zn-ribbon protein|nr:hypothetical protein [Tannerella sp.]